MILCGTVDQVGIDVHHDLHVYLKHPPHPQPHCPGAITENTRAAYPIEFIDNAHTPCLGGHPKNIILLCCDAFGVLPPVSKLTLEQAMYHFISGYTAKVAGTEEGITEPQATFSACFGGAFLMWHPMKYAAMLADKMKQHNCTAWLVNTGWAAGGYDDDNGGGSVFLFAWRDE